jgi:regulator of nucleoside diphosphate kinase
MKYGSLIVQKRELVTLRRLLMQAENRADSIYSTSVAKLSDELRAANIVDEADMPAEVVRLNSIVTINTPHNKDKTFQIVLPQHSNLAENKLSILAPMGLALFGYAQNDKISWEFPSGINKIKILKVQQP